MNDVVPPGAREVDPVTEAQRLADERADGAVPVRALCPDHTTRPVPECRRCRTAAEITAWWKHDQGRCDPGTCVHCERAKGPDYE